VVCIARHSNTQTANTLVMSKTRLATFPAKLIGAASIMTFNFIIEVILSVQGRKQLAPFIGLCITVWCRNKRHGELALLNSWCLACVANSLDLLFGKELDLYI